MKYRVQSREQVNRFFGTLAPETRRKLRQALRELEAEKRDILPLRENLAGFHRLRVGGYRIIFRYLPGRIIECVFAEKRSLVYQLFDREMLEHLRHEKK
jgi:mRNA-degrading endonuclease RelE of RelBE toxin-antitoxin system